MKTENRRRHFFIKRAFQGRFILQFTGLLILGFAAFTAALYFYSHSTLTTTFVDAKLKVTSTAEYLLPALIIAALVVTALAAFTAAIRLLFFSHKIAGPLYRLEKTAEAVGEGNLNLHVRLRSKDELQDFARSLDEMIQGLRTRTVAIKDQNTRLKEILLQADEKETLPPELLQALKETQHRLEEEVSRFQV